VSAAADVDEGVDPMRPWGYWATLGWAILAFLAGQFAAFLLLLWWRRDDLNTLLATPFDGVVVTLFILISNPLTIAMLALAVRLRRAGQADYLALAWPRTRDVTVGLGWLVGLIALTDVLLYLSGHALVTQFQLQSYKTAAAEGWLAPMFAAAIIVAPAGEEIMFRGFLFRGWARSERSTWPAIIAISLLWSTLHVQYDWTGILQIFVVGLFLGWMRWRSGSTLLTFLLHALFNLEGTMETMLQVHFFS
jgi:CAAX protease family protein